MIPVILNTISFLYIVPQWFMPRWNPSCLKSHKDSFGHHKNVSRPTRLKNYTSMRKFSMIGQLEILRDLCFELSHSVNIWQLALRQYHGTTCHVSTSCDNSKCWSRYFETLWVWIVPTLHLLKKWTCSNVTIYTITSQWTGLINVNLDKLISHEISRLRDLLVELSCRYLEGGIAAMLLTHLPKINMIQQL